ncbi:SusD/RagB family nutrient-binding outer membrane lipoprotein [Flavobacterium suncheonense]|uniref:SusD/RagB family nutrient-binding outer membrane lipoprotein n=1 Tax=Flavobacterium suncheonense GH29-5 = DSM 17707 TaxID=1121899 RepID=A0A0A2MKL1_9FLAO|nr:SusD/RagB family nutrient-binding outer membrane lipoprotein [Flavobacterium suncheonense]KGO88855.1 hypothetical protein Q764_10575 [Flavobacterium suncheonense GH29-5 = DSM 17707]
MKRKILYPFAFLAVMSIASCTLDENKSPNSPVYSDISPVLTLSAAQTQTYRAISGDNQNFETSIRSQSMNQLGNLWMNSWAGNVNNTTNPYSEEYRSILSSTFYNPIWDWTYRNVTNFQQIINYDSPNYDNHKAIAKILKSFYMQYIVDLYGDCPYSEAFQGQANLYPKYDDDKLVYRGLVNELDEAIELIENANSSDVTVGAEDAMLAGNMTRWKSFANTIKLRILLRQSELTDTETIAYLDAQFDTLADAQFVDFDVTINPGYNATNANRQNPFYGAYGYTITGQATGNRALITASAHAADALNNTSDPRRSRLFTTTGGLVVGIEQGADSEDAPDNPSFLGPAIIPVPVGTNASVGSSMAGYVMTLSEAKFILAEAAFRYPTKFGAYDAETLFTQGIQASFTRLGVTPAAGATYLANIDPINGFGWNGSADKIEAIMTQKWIALMNVHAIESWIDYVRTGFPVTPLALTNSGVGKPKRLMYPASEYISNTANVPAQTSATVFATGPFWSE